ncbi:MAG: WXG100 family type VII secretion target [Candidatus Viridilinea halotolerans]|uniref:ESAT-6-like protein n=1 Tax=Candidatus Viridilinea halotolerans TaxID=2491704 RepID=A0A426TUE2_9CHLR|nr:MAG: WXG100 family type VII secretion target [Candidatus Viridilinea halotolerans]
MDEVKVEYDELDQIANRFLQQSEAVASMIQQITGRMDPLLQDGWKGLGAQAFFDEMQSEILPACNRLTEVLNVASQTTKSIIQTFQQAEEEASAPFQVRS